MAAGTGATASQAWAILKRHARDEISPLRLQELCRDNDRVSSLVSVHNGAPDRMLLVDLSRQRMTLETLNHLLRLAASRNIRNYIARLAWGQNDPGNPVVPARIINIRKNHRVGGGGGGGGGGPRNNNNNKYNSRSFDDATPMRRKRSTPEQQQPDHPSIPSFHLSLRVPSKQGHEMLDAEGKNALSDIHMEWDRIRLISDSLRRGQLPGVTGSMIRDVVVVGRGVPVMALRFVYLALCKDQAANLGRRSGIPGGQRRIKFLTSVDPVRSAAVVADLDPACTLVISIVLSSSSSSSSSGGGKEETFSMATQTMKTWLLQSLGGGQQQGGRRHEAVLSKHMMLVTGNERMAAAHKPESVFLIPEHSRSEPFCTFTAATLLVSTRLQHPMDWTVVCCGGSFCSSYIFFLFFHASLLYYTTYYITTLHTSRCR
jgi:glucose-6-phosphate isomerase